MIFHQVRIYSGAFKCNSLKKVRFRSKSHQSELKSNRKIRRKKKEYKDDYNSAIISNKVEQVQPEFNNLSSDGPIDLEEIEELIQDLKQGRIKLGILKPDLHDDEHQNMS